MLVFNKMFYKFIQRIFCMYLKILFSKCSCSWKKIMSSGFCFALPLAIRQNFLSKFNDVFKNNFKILVFREHFSNRFEIKSDLPCIVIKKRFFLSNFTIRNALLVNYFKTFVSCSLKRDFKKAVKKVQRSNSYSLINENYSLLLVILCEWKKNSSNGNIDNCITRFLQLNCQNWIKYVLRLAVTHL